MLPRRTLIQTMLAAGLASLCPAVHAAPPRRVIFVHGRAQEGKNPIELKSEWIESFERGAANTGISIPRDVEYSLPFYGDKLDEFTSQADLPLTVDIQTRGADVDEDFLAFQHTLAEEIRVAAGITDAQIDTEYGDNPKERGPLNWEWVQAILRALDKNTESVGQGAIETFTRDVYLYTRRSLVRNTIDEIVAAELDERPTVVVGHSLGSVVAYSVLRKGSLALNVPLYLTVGSPLGVRAIRDFFRPLTAPSVGAWFNAYDDRDVVALYPLDENNFPVDPAIENFDGVRNSSRNRHGIDGYLTDPTVVSKLLVALLSDN